MQPKLWHKKTKFFSPNSCSQTCCSKTMKKKIEKQTNKNTGMQQKELRWEEAATNSCLEQPVGFQEMKEDLVSFEKTFQFYTLIGSSVLNSCIFFIMSPQISFLTNNIQGSFFCSFLRNHVHLKQNSQPALYINLCTVLLGALSILVYL